MLRGLGRILLIVSVLTAGIVAGTTPANAVSAPNAQCVVPYDYSPRCSGSLNPQGGFIASDAVYNDGTDRLCVTDRLGDGHSAVAVYWKPGSYETTKVFVWATGGIGDVHCGYPKGQWWMLYVEDVPVGWKACVGESADHRILSCGPTEQFSS